MEKGLGIMADKIEEQSSMIYFLDPLTIRKMGVEKHRKTRDKCFESHSEYKGQPKQDTLASRQKRWDDLRFNIAQNGFDPNHPITIMLKRKNGKRDQVFQGHHRLAIAIGLQLREVPVRFVTKKN
jgi:hypothetical protein